MANNKRFIAKNGLDANNEKLINLGTPTANTDAVTLAYYQDAGNISSGTLNQSRLPNTSVVAGTYTNATLTVDGTGRLTSASTGTSLVSSFNTRTGAVTLQTSDVSGVNGVVTSGSYSDPAWITSLAGSKITGNISGQSGTVANGVYTTGAYADPSWITSLAGSKISGNITGDSANITAYTLNQNLGTGNSPTFQMVTISGSTTNATDVATKSYVDSVAQGLDVKASVRVATTANITLSGTQTIDGIVLIAGDRVLVKNQTTQANNGIYLVASGSWTRTTDADTYAELIGAFAFVEEGTTLKDTGFVCTNDAGGTLGTTAIEFAQFSGAGTYTAGSGLTLTGSSFAIDSTVATLTGTQTLTNKTLTSPTITGVSPVITLAGDLTGSATLTNLGNATLTATIAANSVTLGTDTTGNYVSDLTAGTGISVSGGGSEGATVTVTNSGIVSITGTANQVLTSASTGAVTLSLPQSINTTSSPTFADLTVNGLLNLQVSGTTYAKTGVATLTTSATTSGQIVDSISATTYRGVKYIVQVISGSAYQAVEILLIHDGTDVTMVEYGNIYTGVSLATFDADISSGNLRLLTTPVNSVTTYKVIRQGLLA